MLCCPMTSHRKGYPFEVVMADEPEHTSVVLADQVKSLDWKGRRAIKKGTAPLNVVSETLSSSRHSSDTPEAMVPRNGDILLFWLTGTSTAADGNRWEPGLRRESTGTGTGTAADGNRWEPGLRRESTGTGTGTAADGGASPLPLGLTEYWLVPYYRNQLSHWRG